jgi:hypothetical protein
MIIGHGQPDITGNAAAFFILPPFPLPELSLAVNESYLDASAGDIALLHNSALHSGFTCLGFHGCGSNAARSILRGVEDVSTTNARGSGFAVGSLRKGIPTHWAGQVKGGGVATLLRIYVCNWHTKQVGRDYEWGKMDPDDKVSKTGVEMVLRPRIFRDIFSLPSPSPEDQSLIHPDIWRDCPAHSFRPDELAMVQQIADHLHMSLPELEEAIEKDGEAIAKVAKSLGFNI